MKQTLYILFAILISQALHSCKSQYSMVELNRNFTTEQIADLNKITEFFRSEMCLSMESDFKTCYERIPHEYLEATGSQFWTKIDFEDQKKLYEQISESTFNEIWSYCESKYYPSETVAESLCANPKGKYQGFLTELGKTNLFIAKYAKRIRAYGSFNTLDIQYFDVLGDKKSLDLNDPNIQLILAIHYLSLNDQTTRNAALSSKGKIINAPPILDSN
ncbi:hypothetical protein [Algoriphagus chordae]|uniref:Uncharacterized protein n=1 Tax=Algoriphagus chordae TaxID=237019 RepID=A0A2W7RG59_9BACT|nr:hypothetical protein [Algoriphagus chordae]PZX53259.1 hypothetical protein LV85_01677 [Algoriphagus chordae]